MRSFRAAGTAAALAAALTLSFQIVPAMGAGETETTASSLDNLQAAYQGESNAHARYLAFAAKADEEGYAGVASLFRAAARAEEVHAGSHAAVIRAMGATPEAEIATPEVKSTQENLQAAIAGESYERDTMYPQFIARAKTEKNKDALRSFNYAKTAEAEHARLYTQALEEMDSWKDARDFYVCTVCGYTTTNLDFSKCVSCFNPKDKYVRVG